jgi:alkylation response protein AidB-like acyl-CoA dehydrogenase
MASVLTAPAPSHPLVAAVRRFVDTEVRAAAHALEHSDRYPHALVGRMRELGLFGALVPEAYGGLGLDVTTYAMAIEELCRGWMSLAGVINSHTMAALIVLHHGTEEQRQRFLPRFARGEVRGGLCLTEPHAGSDVQAIRTTARRRGSDYVINGTKMFVTNGREGNTFALLAVTDPHATPRHRGMSCFIVEKGPPGLAVVKSISKLGYRGVDTAELLYEDFVVPAANLVGGVEGHGFRHVMSGLETGRINIAARAVGVATAAYEEALARAAALAPSPRLADMATRVTAARLLTYWAAGMKDRGERCDLEAGMAKLYASEVAQQVATDALLLHGEARPLASSSVERHYRDAPLMIIGEGTNEIQRTIIARNLLQRYGERLGALTSRATEPDERKQIVLAVRQFVEKQVVAVAQAPAGYPVETVARLAELGLLGAIVPSEMGGLGLDFTTYAMIVEELGRGSATLAGVVTPHLAAAHAIARFGTPEQRERILAPMTRGEILGSGSFADVAPGARLRARRDGSDWVLTGTVEQVENATRVDGVLLFADEGVSTSAFLVGRTGDRLTVGAPAPMLGARGLDLCELTLDGLRCSPAWLLGGVPGHGAAHQREAAAIARLGVAATAVGVAQAAFEAALRYSQQRSAFGKPICEHQAIQLKLADMATTITAARLLTYEAARRLEHDADGIHARMAKLYAAEVAASVTLEAMRVHGGYGYTTEFPVERYYRDAARLILCLGGSDGERTALATELSSPVSGAPPPGGLGPVSGAPPPGGLGPVSGAPPPGGLGPVSGAPPPGGLGGSRPPQQ